MAEVVSLRNVSVSFDGRKVLDGINLSVEEREFLGIIGPNGGGKTTLLKVILGLIRPDEGTVRVFGKGPQAASRELGYVPQHADVDLAFPVTVRDVVLMGRTARRGMLRRFSGADREAARRALEEVQLLSYAGRQIGKLSGGLRQRAFIARALASEPRALLLDEPAASLDTAIGRSLYELLEKLNERITIILVTHDIGVIARSVKNVACMSGKLFVHEDARKIEPETLEKVYGCPVDLIAHGRHPHRVFEMHDHGEDPAGD